MSTIYTTKQDAVEQAIIPALETDDNGVEGYDIDAIFDKAFEYRTFDGQAQRNGFVQVVDAEGFWEIVNENAK